MRRRTFLATTGVAAAVSVAGCSSADSSAYATRTIDGTEVPYAPLEDVYEWYEDDAARIVDARSKAQYDRAHVAGAVFSPAPDGLASDDPVEGWPLDTRIVTYCVCPELLAGQRAASLIDDGYEEVYGLSDGFEPWLNGGYPVESTDSSATLQSAAYDVRGRSDPDHAGEYVWVREPETDQREAGQIAADGSYELRIQFVDVSADTPLVLDAPDYTVEATLAELTSGVVSA